MRHSKFSHINWESVDFSKRDDTIAQELGCSTSTVKYHRNGWYKGQYHRSTWRVNWHKVNWALDNGEIAHQLQCSPSAVGRMRRRFESALPKAPAITRTQPVSALPTTTDRVLGRRSEMATSRIGYPMRPKQLEIPPRPNLIDRIVGVFRRMLAGPQEAR